MFANYLKIAWRNLFKRKWFSLINMLGLAAGMAVCLLIALFIRNELGYDSFLPGAQNIYRLVLERKYPGRSTSYAIIPSSIGNAVHREYPQVLQSTRLFDFLQDNNFMVRIGDRQFEERRVLMADSNFFAVFSMPLLYGDTTTALQKPFSAVISETTAKKYFGSAANAVGKSFISENETSYMITGIVKDWPDNSHMAFDILIAAAGTPLNRDENFTGFSAYTYLRLQAGNSPAPIDAGMPHVVDKYVSPVISKVFSMNYQQFLAAGNGYNYYLQPVTGIHLSSDLEKEMRPNGSMRAIYIFSVIAVFILLIACINFINLSTARSMERAREVGIRKTFGSDKKMLIGQFLTESVLISLISLALAILIVLLLLPLFNNIAGKNISASWLLKGSRLVLLVLFGVLVGLLAGFYPAIVLSSFKPILVLKGKFKSNKYGLLLRNGLVVFQFAISVMLIICTIVVNRQMRYVMGDKLGFNKEHVIQIMESFLLRDKTMAFKNELLRIPGVQAISSSTALPGQGSFFGATFQAVGIGSKEPMTGRAVVTDEQFASALQIKMKAGRFFSKEFLTDSLALVLNERAVEELGLKNPVGP